MELSPLLLYIAIAQLAGNPYWVGFWLALQDLTIPYHTPDMAMQHVLTLQETPKVQRTVDCITAAQPSIS